jgi:hypothetical protein
MVDIDDTLIDDLFKLEKLSVRAINVCKYNSILSLFALLKYYSENNSFTTLRNCGLKTNYELIEFCKKYIDSINFIKDTAPVQKTPYLLETINSLSPTQKAIVNKHCEYLVLNLNVRTYNGIATISEDLNPKEIFETIFSEKFKFKDIRNIGKKSLDELENFKMELTKFVNLIQTVKKEQLSKVYCELIVKTIFKNLSEDFEEQFRKVFDEFGRIRLFTLINYLIVSGQLFKEAQMKIFECSFTNIHKKRTTLEKIGLELKLTRERVRQIKSKLENEIQDYFLFVSIFVMDDLIIYNANQYEELIIIDNNLADKINQNESVNFSVEFYAIIYGILLKKTHTMVGVKELISSKKVVKKKHYKSYYFIDTFIFDCFDFETFVDDIYSKVNEKISETYSLNFSGYIYNFFKGDGKTFYNIIYKIAETIIYKEFELIIGSDGYLIIEQKTKKAIHQYLYEILEGKGEIMNVSEINTLANEKFPFLDLKESSVRGILNKEKELFIYFGRSSTYGLRKWEVENKKLKGGTIRDLAEDFLSTKDSPQHFSDIFDFILAYRPTTNKKSVLTNLRIDESNRFCFFSGDFIGIKSKNYSNCKTDFKKINRSHFRKSIFEKVSGWNIDSVVDYFSKSYGYEEVQIKFLLKQKIKDGELILTNDKKLKI